jgi:AraC-like DNA-binding protein
MTSLAMPLPMPLQLIPPSAGLASCIRGYVSRSTVGQGDAAQSRQNHLPAALTCAITWFIEGKSSVLGPWTDVMERINAARGVTPDSAPVVFNGPRTQGIVTVDRGPVQSFMVVLMPDALRAMAGLDLSAHVDRVSAVSEAFDQAWHRMAQTVLEAPSDALRIQQIEAFLEPRWRAACEQGQSQMRRYQDWVQDLTKRAQDHGHSLRQTQRRIKDWAGLSLRQLQGIVRLESSLNQAQLGDGDAKPDWSQIACDNGFSDQAHFCREVRRASGLSPTALRKAVADDDGYWMYRLLRT